MNEDQTWKKKGMRMKSQEINKIYKPYQIKKIKSKEYEPNLRYEKLKEDKIEEIFQFKVIFFK